MNGDIKPVPLVVRLARVFAGAVVRIGPRAFRAAGGKDRADAVVAALDFDALGPDFVVARDVDQVAAVAGFIGEVRLRMTETNTPSRLPENVCKKGGMHAEKMIL